MEGDNGKGLAKDAEKSKSETEFVGRISGAHPPLQATKKRKAGHEEHEKGTKDTKENLH